jgi:uncharacterized protein YndB with AHSA1/START domain
MAAGSNERQSEKPELELVITRVLDAPRELVWKAWTDPESAAKWWGPKGFTLPHYEMDPRPGGAWRVCMRSPEGEDHWAHGVYKEITEPERLVYTWIWEKGRQDEKLVTVTFAPQGAKTMLTLHQVGFDTVEDRDDHQKGWSEVLDRLAEHVTRA